MNINVNITPDHHLCIDNNDIATKILKHQYKRIAIQVSNEYIQKAKQLICDLELTISNIRNQLKNDHDDNDNNNKDYKPAIVLLADFTTSDCCIDEIAAAHYSCDFIVHIGLSCLTTPNSKITRYLCFPNYHFVEDHLKHAIRKWIQSNHHNVGKKLLVMYGTKYQNSFFTIYESLKLFLPYFDDIYIGIVPIFHFNELEKPSFNGLHIFGRQIVNLKDISVKQNGVNSKILIDASNESAISFESFSQENESKVLYIGNTEFSLQNSFYIRFLLRLGSNFDVLVYDPASLIPELHSNSYYLKDFNRFINYRYSCIEKAQKANKIGIVIGNVSMTGHQELHKHLVAICEYNNKQTISLFIGKLTVNKLENFPEINIFCYIGCSESAFVTNPSDYSKPIITPFELLVAMNNIEWNTNYILDMDELISICRQNPIYDYSLSKDELTSPWKKSKEEKHEGEIIHNSTGEQQQLSQLFDDLIPLKKRTYQGVPFSVHQNTDQDNSFVHHYDENDDNFIQEGLDGTASGYSKEIRK